MASARNARRRHPRAPLQLKCRLTLASNAQSSFEATLKTADLGVGGLFFESTFFLKQGQKVAVEFALPPHQRPVHCVGRIVRVEPGGGGRKGRTGFALRFEEYLGQSEVILANYFLEPILRRFLQRYSQQNALSLDPEDADSLVDLLSAWELWRATHPEAQQWSDVG